MQNLVTVKIPTPAVEQLSSRERRRGDKARRGWVRHVTSVDRSKRGGFALIGDQPFLSPGEMLLPVGAVIVEAHWDGDACVRVVNEDGELNSLRDPESGEPVWFDTKTKTQSLCDLVERGLSITQRELAQQQFDGLRKVCAQEGATDNQRKWLEKARQTLARFEASPQEIDTEALEAERVALLNRLEEIDRLLSR